MAEPELVEDHWQEGRSVGATQPGAGHPAAELCFNVAKWRHVFIAVCGNLSEEAVWFSW